MARVNQRTKEYVGNITLGTKVRVSDPCYDMEVWCAGTLKNVKPGKYACYVEHYADPEWGMRVSAIECRYDGKRQKGIRTGRYVMVPNLDVGVDSGQCGIYDLDYYAEHHADKEMDEEWYDMVGELTYCQMPNPDYKPFRESSFFSEEMKTNLVAMKEALCKWKESNEYSRVKGSFCGDTIDGKGLVSSSGYGDGGYPCYVARNTQDEIVRIKVKFI